MYMEIIELLKKQGIEFERGLTFDEVEQIQKRYSIVFPNSLKKFLMLALPISKGFYNWRNVQIENVDYIMKCINQPREYIKDNPNEIYWCDDWGEAPVDMDELKEKVRKQVEKAPIMIPVYAHRYMPMISKSNPPVISIHGTDVIYYGKDLEDYFKVELGKKEQTEIEFDNIEPVPFWTDIM